MVNQRDRLKDTVTNGLVFDIFEAEQAIALEEMIGINAEAINNQRFGALFGSLQIILNKCLILAVTRLYEQPNPKYLIRSIPVALKSLHKYANEFPIKKKSFVLEKLVELGYDLKQLQIMPNKEITLKIVKHFSGNLPLKPIIPDINEMQDAINMLKIVRNKAIAHRQAIEVSGLKLPSYGKIDQLIDMAKKFVIVIGNGYLGMNYELNGKYSYTSDAKRAGRSLRRLLIKAGILEDV